MFGSCGASGFVFGSLGEDVTVVMIQSCGESNFLYVATIINCGCAWHDQRSRELNGKIWHMLPSKYTNIFSGAAMKLFFHKLLHAWCHNDVEN